MGAAGYEEGVIQPASTVAEADALFVASYMAGEVKQFKL